jgi:hypothetical protein
MPTYPTSNSNLAPERRYSKFADARKNLPWEKLSEKISENHTLKITLDAVKKSPRTLSRHRCALEHLNRIQL